MEQFVNDRRCNALVLTLQSRVSVFVVAKKEIYSKLNNTFGPVKTK